MRREREREGRSFGVCAVRVNGSVCVESVCEDCACLKERQNVGREMRRERKREGEREREPARERESERERERRGSGEKRRRRQRMRRKKFEHWKKM